MTPGAGWQIASVLLQHDACGKLPTCEAAHT